MEITKQIHRGYLPNYEIFGKYQYICSNDKGVISLIELPNYFKDGITLWEIYQLRGNKIFNDVERFKTKSEALKQIKKYLGEI